MTSAVVEELELPSFYELLHRLSLFESSASSGCDVQIGANGSVYCKCEGCVQWHDFVEGRDPFDNKAKYEAFTREHVSSLACYLRAKVADYKLPVMDVLEVGASSGCLAHHLNMALSRLLHENQKEFEGGKLHGKCVYLFGCTEPQLVHFLENSRVIQIHAVVAVTSPFLPSDKIGIKPVQREDELIVSMKDMKMDWVPFIPSDVRKCSTVERVKTQIFTLKCTQRRAALKQLKQERIKKYDYCLPYIYSPLKEDETVDETVVNVMYPFDDEAKPPEWFLGEWKNTT